MEPRFEIEIQDGRLSAVRREGRPRLLFLHGISAHGASWRPVLSRLDPRFGWLAPDLLSRGASTPRPDLSYVLSAEIGRVDEALEELDWRPTIVVGHSHGAAIALGLATRRPDIRGLVLVSPVTPWTRRPPMLRAIASRLMRRLGAGMFRPLRGPVARGVLSVAYGPSGSPSSEMVRLYAEPYADSKRARALLRVLSDWRPAELAAWLPERTLSVEVLAGDSDPRIKLADAHRLAAALSGRCAVVTGGGHVLVHQAPEQVAQAIESVARDVEHRAPSPATGIELEGSGDSGRYGHQE